MEPAIVLLGSFMIFVVVIGTIGFIYYFYSEKKRKEEH